MKKWKIRKYYQLEDFFPIGTSDDWEDIFMDAIADSFLERDGTAGDWQRNSQYAKYTNFKNIFVFEDNMWDVIQKFNECFAQIVIRHQGDIIFALDEDEDTQENNTRCLAQWLASMIFIANNTAPRYTKLLELYDSNKSKLMDALKNTTSSNAISKFNDTPENTGDFEGESYTTNVTIGDVESTTELNPMTAMERLREIEESYRNVMLQWVNEFDRLFIDGANI